MENGPFEDVFPIKKWSYSIAMLVYQRVIHGFLFGVPSPKVKVLYKRFWGLTFLPGGVWIFIIKQLDCTMGFITIIHHHFGAEYVLFFPNPP